MKTLLALLLFLSPAVMADLIFADGALRAKLTWLQAPHLSEASALRIEWLNGNSQSPIEPPGPFKVSLWMPAHGHGSSPVTVTKTGIGVFEVSNMYFTMGGDWEVRVKLKYTNGREETQKLPVTLKGGGHH